MDNDTTKKLIMILIGIILFPFILVIDLANKQK